MLSTQGSNCHNGKVAKSQKAKGKAHQAGLYRMPGAFFERSIEDFYIALDTPVALSCLMLYRAGEYAQLVRKEIDPGQYNDPCRFRDDFTAVSFLRKSQFLKTGIDLKAEALLGFKKAELQCKDTNNRFSNLLLDPKYSGAHVWLLHSLTRKIASILGSFNYGELFDKGTWGPGVSHLVKGKDVSAPRKFRDERGITATLYPLIIDSLQGAYPLWYRDGGLAQLEQCPGNIVITVPKNAKTDRTIAIEPGMNTWFQLAAGRQIRHKLRRAGFNLDSDVKNQNGALKGSQYGLLATVDFSSASDTISKRLVEEILPPDWFRVLDALRSPCYTLDRTTLPYEKFSAMGCGFTFELESLIFVAAALCVAEYVGVDDSDVSVFGDDIILPVEGVALYSSFCDFLGFTVNTRKTFASGYFRESCGSYFFKGLDVKPLFLKENKTDVKAIYRLANGIRLLSHRRNFNSGCDWKFRTVWAHLVKRLPADLRIYGSRLAGDACLIVNFDEACPRRAQDQWEGFLHAGLITRSVNIKSEDPAVLIARVWRASTGALGNEIPLRAVTKLFYKKNMLAPQWYNFGPWI